MYLYMSAKKDFRERSDQEAWIWIIIFPIFLMQHLVEKRLQNSSHQLNTHSVRLQSFDDVCRVNERTDSCKYTMHYSATISKKKIQEFFLFWITKKSMS